MRKSLKSGSVTSDHPGLCFICEHNPLTSSALPVSPQYLSLLIQFSLEVPLSLRAIAKTCKLCPKPHQLQHGLLPIFSTSALECQK